MTRRMKVLLIGSQFPGIASAQWFDGELPNIADYDLLIVNGVQLEKLMQEPQAPKRELSLEQFKYWNARLSKIRERTRKLLKTGGRIIAIVGEDTYRHTPADPDKLIFPLFLASSYWLPLPIRFKTETGDTITVINQEFARYMETVGGWRYYLEVDDEDSRSLVKDIRDEHDWGQVRMRGKPIATNRQELSIAGTYSYSVHERPGGLVRDTPVVTSGALDILPPPTDHSVEVGIGILLEDLCGIAPRSVVPAWAEATPSPGSADALKRVSSIKKQIERANSRMNPLLAELQRREGFKAILYETGIEPLQNRICELFEEMGLTAKASTVSDEFVVEHRGKELLVEVKGNDKSAKLSDLRQLIDYQLEHEQTHGSQMKCALVVNAWRHLPPDERGQPGTAVFPDNVIRRAKANEIALVDTRQLYDALSKYWAKTMDGATLFSAIYNSIGPANP